jgi:urease accessory protein
MLYVFKPLVVVRDVHSSGTVPARAREYARDTITLAWEERQKTRARRRSDLGVEFGTALARGLVLKAGDLLVCDALATCIQVVERPEPVLVIQPSSPEQWALFAYHIGNSHQPLMITSSAIVCPDALGTSEVLDYHGIQFTRDVRPFTPVSHVLDHEHQAQ